MKKQILALALLITCYSDNIFSLESSIDNAHNVALESSYILRKNIEPLAKTSHNYQKYKTCGSLSYSSLSEKEIASFQRSIDKIDSTINRLDTFPILSKDNMIKKEVAKTLMADAKKLASKLKPYPSQNECLQQKFAEKFLVFKNRYIEEHPEIVKQFPEEEDLNAFLWKEFLKLRSTIADVGQGIK
ncbi:MAG: hypothetical protein AB7R69_02145 [Candidatus Babeliales bacterium]